jgi:hypothetical protein
VVCVCVCVCVKAESERVTYYIALNVKHYEERRLKEDCLDTNVAISTPLGYKGSNVYFTHSFIIYKFFVILPNSFALKPVYFTYLQFRSHSHLQITFTCISLNIYFLRKSLKSSTYKMAKKIKYE